MKKKLLTLAVALLSVFTLSGCGGGKQQLSETEVYAESYGLHYSTLNYMISQSANDSIFFANMVEGLLEADNYGRIVGVGATEWKDEILPDGRQTWTFKLNPDIKWYDPANDMKEYAPVVAADYVESAKYILNPMNASATVGLLSMFLDGAAEYYDGMANGTNPDFSKVGVKALDDYTLQYTLPYPMSYFPTVLTYSCFNPVNGEYLKSQGINFGTSKDTLLVNGPYYITLDEKDSKVFMAANENYWNKDFVEVKELQFIFADPTAGFDWARLKYENGELSQLRLNENDLTGWDKYVKGPDGTGTLDNPYDPAVFNAGSNDKYSFGYYINVGRYYQDHTTKYARTNHKDDASKANTAAALLNQTFRQAIQWGLDVTLYNQASSPDIPDQRTRNIYMPNGLAFDQNGKDYIEYYYEEFAKQKNIPVAQVKTMLADGNDYYEDDAYAMSLFKQAAEELAGTVTFPVTLDFLCSVDQTTFLYQKAMIDDLNSKFGDYVNMQPVEISGQEEYQTLYNSQNWDIYGMTGWGPDFADPLTYADTFTLGVGYMLDFVGLNAGASEDPAYEALRQEVLGKYTDMVAEANSYNQSNNIDKRFEKFAEAEYYLLNELALFIPAYSRVGSGVYASKIIPKSMPDAMYGNSYQRYKYMRLHDGVMTKEIREDYIAQHDANRPQ